MKLSVKNAEPLNLSIGLCSSPVSPCSFEMPSNLGRVSPWPSWNSKGSRHEEVRGDPSRRFRALPPIPRTTLGLNRSRWRWRSCHSMLTTISESPAHRDALRSSRSRVCGPLNPASAGSCHSVLPAWCAVPADRMLHLLIESC